MILFEKLIQREVEKRLREQEEQRWISERFVGLETRINELEHKMLVHLMKTDPEYQVKTFTPTPVCTCEAVNVEAKE